ncbi:ABC transporter ATP-binding protein [Propionibacteriaceae bacterium Y1700]|uniref:ABC transporter ATP-binding protein n=1 Tax=Microlunatus sp. Y1700 TaxID=3418487 RepID=UPI003DA6EF88
MRDFPPVVTAYTQDSSPGSDRQTERPDTRTPTRFLLWMLRQQADVLAVSVVVGLLWIVPQMIGPWVTGKVVDEGILTGDFAAIWRWSAILLVVAVVGASCGILLHTYAVRGWLLSLYRTSMMVTRKSAQMGHVLPRRSPTGEVLSVSSSDSDQFGALSEVAGRAIGALVGFIVVAVIILSTSPKLGLVVLIGAPVMLIAALPLLRPLHRSQAVERTRTSELTSRATDIVAGLRILRGIGGEQTFGRNYADQSQRAKRAGVRVGVWNAATEGASVIFSGLFLVLLTWLGAGEVAAGRLTVGQLISFFGYALFMTTPLRTFFFFAQQWTRALVAAGKAIAVFEQTPPWNRPADPAEPDPTGELVDQESGTVIRPGELTVVVCGVPDESAALADRLGRYLPREDAPIGVELDEGTKGRQARRERAERRRRRAELAERDAVRAGQPWGVTLADVDLSRFELDRLREVIMVNESNAAVFSGTLQEAVDPHGRLTREQAESAITVASAEDVYEALPGGWQGRIDERGRGLSGGQRQRLVLARAVAADPEILIMVEPTSAVDAHTEARIAERLSDHRRGRTTVITSVSPLLLHHADRVVLLVDGQAVASGTHDELITGEPAYAAVVSRALDAEEVSVE